MRPKDLMSPLQARSTSSFGVSIRAGCKTAIYLVIRYNEKVVKLLHNSLLSCSQSIKYAVDFFDIFEYFKYPLRDFSNLLILPDNPIKNNCSTKKRGKSPLF